MSIFIPCGKSESLATPYIFTETGKRSISTILGSESILKATRRTKLISPHEDISTGRTGSFLEVVIHREVCQTSITLPWLWRTVLMEFSGILSSGITRLEVRRRLSAVIASKSKCYVLDFDDVLRL